MLYRDGVEIALTPKQAETLLALIEQRGEIVSKDHLMHRLWGETAVEESNLIQNIYVLRKILGETRDGQPMIETLRRRGYRFNAELTDHRHRYPAVSAAIRLAALNEAKEAPLETEGTRELESVPSKGTSKYWIIGGVVAAAVLGVLAFAAFSFYPPFAARDTGTAVLAPKPAILATAPSKRGTENAEAYDLYLLAMNLSEERGVQNLQRSLEYLDRAVALDPNYAVAWAAKALIHRDIVGHSDAGQKEHYNSSMEALKKALAIDPNLSEAHSALCSNKFRYEYDAEGAETECKRAIELDPTSPIAHKIYAQLLYTRGRFDESIAEIKTAMDLQPVSYRNRQIYALALHYARRFAGAEEQFKRLIELNPNHSPFIQDRLIRVLVVQGKEFEAYQVLVEQLKAQKADVSELARYKEAYESSGWRGVVAEQIKAAELEGSLRPYQLACLYAKIEDKNKAFENLEKAFQQRSFQIAILHVDPELDSLRSDPRFADLVKRVESH